MNPDASTSGNDSNDNNGSSGNIDPVAACQEIEDLLEACVSSLAGSLSCGVYADLPCDLGPYLNCIADAYGECVDGDFPNLDFSEFQNCGQLAVCD